MHLERLRDILALAVAAVGAWHSAQPPAVFVECGPSNLALPACKCECLPAEPAPTISQRAWSWFLWAAAAALSAAAPLLGAAVWQRLRPRPSYVSVSTQTEEPPGPTRPAAAGPPALRDGPVRPSTRQ